MRPLVFHLFFTLSLGSVVVKVFRAWRVLGAATSNKLKKVKITVKDALVMLAQLCFVDVVLIAFWFASALPEAVATTQLTSDGTEYETIECESKIEFYETGLVFYKVR